VCKGFLGTQEISSTPAGVPDGHRVTKSRLVAEVLAATRANKSTTVGTAERVETKRGRTVGEKSELPIVPRKPGNLPKRTRRREGAVEQQQHWRERWQELRVLMTSQRNDNASRNWPSRHRRWS